jgi:hypothetical protein
VIERRGRWLMLLRPQRRGPRRVTLRRILLEPLGLLAGDVSRHAVSAVGRKFECHVIRHGMLNSLIFS